MYAGPDGRIKGLSATEETPEEVQQAIESFRDAFRRQAWAPLEAVFKTWDTRRAKPTTLYRGSCFATVDARTRYLDEVGRGGVQAPTSCSTDVHRALIFASPGQLQQSLLYEHLRRHKYHVPATAEGLLCIFDHFPPMDIGEMKQAAGLGANEDEVWFRHTSCRHVFTTTSGAELNCLMQTHFSAIGALPPKTAQAALLAYLGDGGGRTAVALFTSRPADLALAAAPLGNTAACVIEVPAAVTASPTDAPHDGAGAAPPAAVPASSAASAKVTDARVKSFKTCVVVKVEKDVSRKFATADYSSHQLCEEAAAQFLKGLDALLREFNRKFNNPSRVAFLKEHGIAKGTSVIKKYFGEWGLRQHLIRKAFAGEVSRIEDDLTPMIAVQSGGKAEPAGATAPDKDADLPGAIVWDEVAETYTVTAPVDGRSTHSTAVKGTFTVAEEGNRDNARRKALSFYAVLSDAATDGQLAKHLRTTLQKVGNAVLQDTKDGFKPGTTEYEVLAPDGASAGHEEDVTTTFWGEQSKAVTTGVETEAGLEKEDLGSPEALWVAS